MSDVVTINDVEYKIEDMSERARAILSRLNYVGVDVERCRAQLDILQVAEVSLKNMLREELDKENEEAA